MAFRDPDDAFLAHDLSQLLWAIQGRARLLARRLAPADAEAVDTIAEHAAAAAALLADHATLRPCADLADAARRAWLQAHDRAVARGQTVTCAWRPPPSAPAIGLPEVALRRILANLFANALDAQAGSGRLTCDAQVADRGTVVITVQDGGPGLPQDLRARLFEPGVSGSGQPGRGLGLAGARSLARRWGGDLAVGTSSGGARFLLSLPVADEAAAIAVDGDDANGAPSGPLRLLVVDDEAAVSEMLGELLAADGHRVTLAASATAARASFRAGAYEVVLIDLGLLDGSGADLAVALRLADPTLAVILMTGWGCERELAGCPADAADLTAVKPLDLPQLRRLLARAQRLADGRRRGRDEEV